MYYMQPVELTLQVQMKPAPKSARYVGASICVLGGMYLGNAYGATYWRFDPFNLGWDTIVRGGLLVLIGIFLIAISK